MEFLLPITKGLQLDSSAVDGETSLLLAARLGNRYVVKLLATSGGMSVSHKDKRGDTALLHACRGGFEGVVQELIAAGADVDSKDARGHTPIEYAALLAPHSRLHARIELLLYVRSLTIYLFSVGI